MLRRLGVAVDFPAGQTCCGQPAYNAGYADAARISARAFLRAFDGSEHVVSISGSCTAMVRDGYPRLFAGRPEEQAAADLAARTFEFSEFLVDVLGVTELPVTAAAGRRDRWPPRAPGGAAGARRAPAAPPSTTPATRSGCSAWPSSRSPCSAWSTASKLVPLVHPELCCGFGGTFAVKMSRISAAMVDEKVDDVLAIGRRPARRARCELPC